MLEIDLAADGRIRRGTATLPLAETRALLDGIAAAGAIGGAATATGRSYRGTWSKLAAIEALLGRRLAERIKGHGTRLTPAGEALRSALAETQDRLAAPLAREAEALAARLTDALALGRPALRLVASHDPLLLAALAGDAGIHADIAGSAEALAALRAGRCDLAGCHFGATDAAPPQKLRAELAAAGLRAWRLFRRAQGLITAPGNPLDLRGVGDIARRGARFVNRQRGSGTRAWFDRMLAEAGIPARAIKGYDSAEFTHQAVAAVIAAGQADVALGVEAAAHRFGLAFVPLGEESYFLLAPARHAEDPRLRLLLQRLRTHRANIPGYRA